MTVSFEKDGFVLTQAQATEDLRAAQKLRYDVFVRELGGQGDGIDHAAGLESDRYDAVADHLILRDCISGDVVGTYRLLQAQAAEKIGGFYTSTEFDISPLLSSGRRLLELGRSCVRADHRSGPALYHLWTGLTRYVELHGFDLLFGAASLPGTDPARLRDALSLLHHRFRAPAHLRPTSHQKLDFDLIPPGDLDMRAAMVSLPPLLKSYLRMGGQVGDGVFVDHAFGCTDICLVMDRSAINTKMSQRYQRAAAG